ncbi:MAG TPA: ABC-type transport auxiliary lipoprotein family protein [Steroidobacteraceae bacterium]|jgi:cholesterol transport system auxiliary component|nr:ABC-type transport auxiliary lipoprotein family protein [Steroidobacteraceae bacterium]
MRFRHVVIVGVALIVSACSIGRPIPTATTYSIEPSPAALAIPKPPHPERLRVERVRVAAAYDRTALVYRLSAVRYVSDPYHTFLADPGPMLSNRIAEWLAAAGLFKAVDPPGGAAPAPWVLEATVTELYGDFEAGGDNPAAVMSIRFTIIDEGSARPKVTYERSLSRRVPVSHAAPEALVSGYGMALADILTQLGTDLSNSTLQ